MQYFIFIRCYLLFRKLIKNTHQPNGILEKPYFIYVFCIGTYCKSTCYLTVAVH